jgi:hypothetical protein
MKNANANISPAAAGVAARQPGQPFSTGRRRVPRRGIDMHVGLLISGTYYLANAYEIGEGGMLVDSPVPIAENQRIVISFRIPGVLYGVILSRTVYILKPKKAGDKMKYGVQFEQVDFDIKRKIRNFVASNFDTDVST